MKVSGAVVTLLATTVAGTWFDRSYVGALDESLSVPGDNPLQYCQQPKDYILEIKKVDLDPNPPKPGTNLTITASGHLSEDIEEGAQVHLIVKYGLIKLIEETVDLCENAKQVNLTCPVKKGDITIKKDAAIPSVIPPGKYFVSADVFTKDKETITCLQASVTFSRGSMIETGDL